MRILNSHHLQLLSLVLTLVLTALAPCNSASTSARQASIARRHRVSSKQHGIELQQASLLGGSIAKTQKDNSHNDDHDFVAALVRGGSVHSQSQAIAGAVVMTLMEQAVRKTFAKFGVAFPSQLGGCMILLTVMLLAEAVLPGWGESIYEQLAPGAGLLAKWLPSFFVPGLAMLPLAPSIGNGMEIAKVLAVIILGFVFSLSTVAFSVLALRSAQGTLIAPAVPKGLPKSSSIAAAAAPPKPFRDETMNQLLQGVVISGILSAAVNKSGRFTEYQTLLRTIFFGITTVAAYVWGARLPSSFTSLIHPLVTSTALTWTAVCGYAIFTKSTFLDVLRTYKVGTLAPLKTGAGDILLHLLGPAVVSFAVSMYSRKKLLKDNLLVLLTAMLISSIGGLFGTAAFVRAIDLGGQTGVLVRLSVLSRNVTTALAMVVTSILGGDVSLVAAVVVLTGIIGATFGRSLLDTMRIQDPVARGVGIGASSQGLGVASLAGEPDAFPFAAMSMVLNAIAATVLVSIPAVKTALVELASGTATK